MVLTNSGKIENIGGSINTSDKQSSLVSINATGNSGSISVENDGDIHSFGMIDIQADKDISVDKSYIYKIASEDDIQLMPNIITMNAKEKVTIKNNSIVYNPQNDDRTNIFINAGTNSAVTSNSAIASSGGIDIRAKVINSINSDASISSINAPINISSNDLTWIDDARLNSKDDIYIRENQVGNKGWFDTTSISNSDIEATGDLIVDSDHNTQILLGTSITAKNLIVDSKSSTHLKETGKIDVKENSLIRSGGNIEINNVRKDDVQGVNFSTAKELNIIANDIDIINSNLESGKSITARSLDKDIDIIGSRLNSIDGYIAAVAEKGDINFSKNSDKFGTTHSETLIVSAAGNTNISDQWLSATQVAISSGRDTNLNSVIVSKNFKSNKTGDMTFKSGGKTELNTTVLFSDGNIDIDSKDHLTVVDTNITAGNNLSLFSDKYIYNNVKLDKKSDGKLFHNYKANSKENKFSAGGLLSVSSGGSQLHQDTDIKAAGIQLKSEQGIGFSDNIKLKAKSNSDIKEPLNGSIQIVNNGETYLNSSHALSADEDIVINSKDTIDLYNVPKIEAKRIQLKTTHAKKEKNNSGYYNKFGKGDINVVGTELVSTGQGEDSLIIDAANHIKVINSKTRSNGSTTIKSGDLMRINNSSIDADKNIILDSNYQIAFNANGKENTNGWLTYLNVGNTSLKAGEVASISSKKTQAYNNIDVTAGAILANSGSYLGLGNDINFNAKSTLQLANNKTVIDGKPINELNGDLSLSAKGDLTIDPDKVNLYATGDVSLTSREDKLHLIGHKGTQGLGSERVVNISTVGDINLTGKEVLIEGSNLTASDQYHYSWYGDNPYGATLESVDNHSINIIATDGNVELKGIKNSFNNKLSNYKLKIIRDNIREVDELLVSTQSDAQNAINQLVDPITQADTSKEGKDKIDRLTTEYLDNISLHTSLSNLRPDLQRVLETSNKASSGHEHKAASLKAGDNINIGAKKGVLIEGADFISTKGGINITAQGNLPTLIIEDGGEKADGFRFEDWISYGLNPDTPLTDYGLEKSAQFYFDQGYDAFGVGPVPKLLKDKKPDKYYYNDSIRITGLADVYRQGSIDGNGNITGNNYSFHKLINQPTLSALGDINISGGGSTANSKYEFNIIDGSKLEVNNNAIVINSANINSKNGDIKIDATKGNVELEASQVDLLDGSQTTSTSRKWYGKKKTKTTTITKNISNGVATDLTANNIEIRANNGINIHGSDLTTNNQKGKIDIKAGDDIKLYVLEDRNLSEVEIKKRSSFLGIKYSKENSNDTRSEIKQVPSTFIADSSSIKTANGSILLQGTVFKSLKPDTLIAGYDKYDDSESNIIFAPAVSRSERSYTLDKNNTVWQKTVDKGHVTETAQLPKFNQTPTIVVSGEVIVALPVSINKNNKAKSDIQKSPEELGKIALNLSKQPGYEYLADLDKRNDINWVQVDLIQQEWDYTQEGLTPGAAALIALAVGMATGGTGAVGASSLGITSAAGSAAFSSLASQAAVMLINNKGDISKTLDQLASSSTVRSMATAALTAGITARLGISSDVSDSLSQKVADGMARGFTNATVNAAINGTSFEEALKNSLRSSLVDVFAAEAFSELVKPLDSDELIGNFAHKLVAAGVGCIAAEANKQNCSSGAMGAAIGEIVADYLMNFDNQIALATGDLSQADQDRILNISQATAVSIALLYGYDVDTAANIAKTAVVNNALMGDDLIDILQRKGKSIANKFNNPGIQGAVDGITNILSGVVWIGDTSLDTLATAVHCAGGGSYCSDGMSNNKEKADALIAVGTQLAKDAKSGALGRQLINWGERIKAGDDKAFRELGSFSTELLGAGVLSKMKASQRACFAAGTLVETINGLKAIETIEQGDLVWSRHEETLEYGYRPVVNTVSFDNKEIYEIVVRDNYGKLETYQTTEEHPFWVVDTGWLPASLLQTGMTLVNRDDEAILTVVSQNKLNKTDTVYNFEVAEFHTYHIGKFGTWVHNADCLGNFTRQNAGTITIVNDNPKRGLLHILKRHSADKYLQNPKGDLFPKGTTDDQIIEAINTVYSTGTRVSHPSRVMQTFEKRIRLNGESANYRLSVDTAQSDVVTFFKIGQ